MERVKPKARVVGSEHGFSSKNTPEICLTKVQTLLGYAPLEVCLGYNLPSVFVELLACA